MAFGRKFSLTNCLLLRGLMSSAISMVMRSSKALSLTSLHVDFKELIKNMIKTESSNTLMDERTFLVGCMSVAFS